MNAHKSNQLRIGNLARSMLLLAGLVVLLGVLGYRMFGPAGLWLAGLVAVLALVFERAVDPLWLMRMQRARPITPAGAPRLYAMLDALLERAGVNEAVQLYLVPAAYGNAMTVGRDGQHAIAITEGLLGSFTEEEIAAILAHETSHISNRDISIAVLVGMLVNMIASLAQVTLVCALLFLPFWIWGGSSGWWLEAMLLAFIAPPIAVLMQMALSRTREFDADLGAAHLLGDPRPMIAALVKLERMHRRAWIRRYFPVLNRPAHGLLASHPATADRIARLESLREASWR